MEHKLDVSMLEPCEPLERTLAAIHHLKRGDHLKVIHRREPHPLYPLLEKAGFSWRCLNIAPDSYEIFIWRQQDAEAEAAVKQYYDS